MNELTDHMKYLDGMERIDSDILENVISAMDAYDYGRYTPADVRRALNVRAARLRTSPRCSLGGGRIY